MPIQPPEKLINPKSFARFILEEEWFDVDILNANIDSFRDRPFGPMERIQIKSRIPLDYFGWPPPFALHLDSLYRERALIPKIEFHDSVGMIAQAVGFYFTSFRMARDVHVRRLFIDIAGRCNTFQTFSEAFPSSVEKGTHGTIPNHPCTKLVEPGGTKTSIIEEQP